MNLKAKACLRAILFFIAPLLIPLSLLLFILSTPLIARSPQQAVRNFVTKFQSLKVFQAYITISSGSQNISGTLSYQNTRFHLKLDDGRVLAGNGLYAIGYNPNQRVAGKQKLGPPRGGLSWLLGNRFHYELHSSEAVGKAKDPNDSIQDVRLRWGANDMFQSISTKRKNSTNWQTIRLSNIQKRTSFAPSLFSYRPPSGSRTVENPLRRRGQRR